MDRCRGQVCLGFRWPLEASGAICVLVDGYGDTAIQVKMVELVLRMDRLEWVIYISCLQEVY